MKREEFLISQLPDREAAQRFLTALSPTMLERLRRDEGLFSDVLALASFSPLLATTMVQHEDYVSWLGKCRTNGGMRTKEDLSESLARFAMVQSQMSPEVVYSRFRRRELLRIYLRDIRHLSTIAEVTEEISNVADTILEAALAEATRQIEARYGRPQTRDEKGRFRSASFAIVALGKLGSHELNYASDIDLLFIYSDEGETGSGDRGQVTNREYFVKLAQMLTKLVGDPSGDAAYRVDLRLRPNGTMGPIAMSLPDTVRYYHETARQWERQVLIRSRCSAGDPDLFKRFWAAISPLVFSVNETPATALQAVRSSKEGIDHQAAKEGGGLNVKLGSGGIREIEFIAQALQLAYGGRDNWLRAPHTLVSLSRLADRGHLTDSELTELSTAYDLLRRTEHVLQMENGLQTHTIPAGEEKERKVSAKLQFVTGGELRADIPRLMLAVHRTFRRIFGDAQPVSSESSADPTSRASTDDNVEPALTAFDASPHFSAMIATNPTLIASIQGDSSDVSDIAAKTLAIGDFAGRLNQLRREWSREMLRIVRDDLQGVIDTIGSRRRQTQLAEISLDIALRIVADEMRRRYGRDEISRLSVLALDKLGGGGVDYGSDLDLLLTYDEVEVLDGPGQSEYFSRAAELLVTALSSMTREGSLYRVDLRLRPFGAKGPIVSSGASLSSYMTKTAEVWELLAFVKLRGVSGSRSVTIENDIRSVIHERAAEVPSAKLRSETLSMRARLEQMRISGRRTGDIDIKYGEGGMLDVYFATRYLQLRDSVPDSAEDRSTRNVLTRLHAHGSLSTEQHDVLRKGYDLLSTLDHNIRLIVGRSTKVPVGQEKALATIADRMELDGSKHLIRTLTLERLEIRHVFNEILEVGENNILTE